jgi:hypothetical protein
LAVVCCAAALHIAPTAGTLDSGDLERTEQLKGSVLGAKRYRVYVPGSGANVIRRARMQRGEGRMLIIGEGKPSRFKWWWMVLTFVAFFGASLTMIVDHSPNPPPRV